VLLSDEHLDVEIELVTDLEVTRYPSGRPHSQPEVGKPAATSHARSGV
jgi:hypothetical protein